MLQRKKRDRGCRYDIKEEVEIEEKKIIQRLKERSDGKKELRNEGWFAGQLGKRDSEGGSE